MSTCLNARSCLEFSCINNIAFRTEYKEECKTDYVEKCSQTYKGSLNRIFIFTSYLIPEILFLCRIGKFVIFCAGGVFHQLHWAMLRLWLQQKVPQGELLLSPTTKGLLRKCLVLFRCQLASFFHLIPCCAGSSSALQTDSCASMSQCPQEVLSQCSCANPRQEM